MAVSVYTGAGGGVASFNGRKGKVVPANGDYTKAQVGLGNVDNTSDANKPISTATQAALNEKQSKITANGILKGDGSGNITAASETEVELVSLPNICNPNLLDNWYFGNPVNQRGQTSYTDTGYTIDRWKFGGYSQTITLATNGIIWDTNTGVWWAQTIENWDALVGKTATVSALIGGNLYSVSGVVNNSDRISVAVSEKVTLEISPEQKGVRLVTYVTESTSVGAVLAIKLELGSQQTLAHQENGAWVLNEIPDYGDQLRRCQRYAQNGYFYTVIGQLIYSGTVYVIPLRFMQDMRTPPTITLKEISAHGWGNVPISSAEITWTTQYGAFVVITDLSTKENYIGKACYVSYFASADL